MLNLVSCNYFKFAKIFYHKYVWFIKVIYFLLMYGNILIIKRLITTYYLTALCMAQDLTNRRYLERLFLYSMKCSKYFIRGFVRRGFCPRTVKNREIKLHCIVSPHIYEYLAIIIKQTLHVWIKCHLEVSYFEHNFQNKNK